MHPNPAFRSDDHDLFAALIRESGFGMVFLTTPEGPRVAHVPLLLTDAGTLRFHLARGNALTRHLDGAKALAVVNGPEGYISARWYADPDQVPTWNYLALEMEGTVRRMDWDGLLALLEDVSAHHEARVAQGAAWTMDKMDTAKRDRMMDMIVGFELTIEAWRPTVKLSQNKPAAERDRLVAGLKDEGHLALAAAMERLAKGAA
ncbi:FMN-binding negative transcriptional regulator [Erythrobacter sp. BLCC-B19]|uniref:FMN-binding negative transcriptional regulator n=1 Tax=Erythrobacter sp. BLCC-B19 TaxID=3025315 RepID=UPI00236104D4|nr:FMN-binding negative transcriptional regulator [Erythrobacter sp. BLCC-B19]WDA41612.1 FMN-binding negative transcriptional regulator [Erythrobacter sp. BLCC-B19]